MPAAMHAFYLRHFYVQNELAAGTLEIAGRTVDLGAITSPTYVVSAVNDHIVPWQAAYKTVGLLRAGAVRAGQRRPHRRHRQPARAQAVVPGGGRRGRRRAAADARRLARRRAAARRDVVGGLRAMVGRALRAVHGPPGMGSAAHPVLDDAPGRYVHG